MKVEEEEGVDGEGDRSEFAIHHRPNAPIVARFCARSSLFLDSRGSIREWVFLYFLDPG